MNGLNDWNDDEVEMEIEMSDIIEEQEEFEEEEESESEGDPDELDYDIDIEGDESEYTDKCPVDITHFVLRKKLGTGAYGTVFLVEKNRGLDVGQIYALKVITKEEVVKIPKTIIHMKAERKALEILRECPYIQKLYYAFQTADKLFLVTEYLPGGEMFTQVQKGPLPEEHVRFYIAELIVALEYIHLQGIVYRDIKLENVLMDADGHVKLVDFGLCKKLGVRGRSKSFCGTEEYMAPEVIACTGHNTSADWWALGVLAIELLSTITPFGSNEGPTKIMDRISHEDPIMPPNISKEMEHFLLQILTKDPAKRLGGSDVSAISLKEHILFDGVDWEKLSKKEIPAPVVPTITHAFDTQNFSDEFTKQPASYAESAEPPHTFLTFKGYSYIAPEFQPRQLADSSFDENRNSLTRYILSNRDPDSKFYQKYTFTSHQPLGTGESSVCMKCFSLSDHNYYAVKIYKRADVNDNEIDVLEKAAAQRFPGVVHLFEVLTDSKWAYLVMELIEGVNCLEYLSTKPLNGTFIFQLVEALWGIVNQVHNLNYTHGRICFKNIYHVKQTDELRLIGFSKTKPITEEKEKQLDYWSMGVCIYTILCGHSPFNLSTSNDTVTYIRIENSEFDQDSKRWSTLNKGVKHLIDQLIRDPTATLNYRALTKLKRSSLCTVVCSKELLDENKTIVEIRASRAKTPVVIKTEAICAANRITNGNDPTENHEDDHEDVVTVNADHNHQSQSSNIIPEESQTNHTELNGHVQKLNSKRRKDRTDEDCAPNQYKKMRQANVDLIEPAPLLKPEEIKQERGLRKRVPKNYAQNSSTKLRKDAAKAVPVSTDEVEQEKTSSSPTVPKTKPKNTIKKPTTKKGRGRPKKNQTEELITANSAETSSQRAVTTIEVTAQIHTANRTKTTSSGQSAMPAYQSNWVYEWRPVRVKAPFYCFERFDYI